jgi:hypothetical protein
MPNDETSRRTTPTSATREAERHEAQTPPGPDRPPTPEEEAAAPTELTDEQRAHEREMLERGANQKGEGRIP